MANAYILSAVRTPIGSFGGVLSTLNAIQLGGVAVQEALKKAGVKADNVQELLMGNVVSAGLGQAPATQVAIEAGLGDRVPATLVNKVCASGMKAIMFAAQSIQVQNADVIIAGGMESMSNIPYYLMKARTGYRYGNGEIIDGLQYDGLTDPYNHCAMGVCADQTAVEMKLSRQAQDDYAIQSYKRTADAWRAGRFAEEVILVTIKDRKGLATEVKEDEEYLKVNFEKMPSLKPAFSKDGTVTAANASTLNDGASALVIASEQFVKKSGLKPLARILGYADAAQDPMHFTTTPSIAMPLAMERAGIKREKVDFFEINEAFAAVALANMINLQLDPGRVNVNGGAVAMGHPLGASGARIVTTLVHTLKQNKATLGVAGICNGGGGASAIVIENL